MAVKKKESGGVSTTSFDKYKNLIIDPRVAAAAHGHWSTGSPRLDKALGGGITKGRISEAYGRESTGKSTLALSVSRGVIAKGGRVLYIDLERGLEIQEPGTQSWLTINGIDAFNGTFDVVQQAGKEPIPGEIIYDMIIGAWRNKTYQFIVLDSMAALVTRAELEGEIGDATFGSVARVNSLGLKTLFALQGGNRETSLYIINQVRDQLQGGMGGLKSTGGRALPHYGHQKLRFDKLGPTKEQTDGDYLTPIRVRVEKARGAPAREVELTISARRGIDVLSEVFEVAQDLGYIHQHGAWYTYCSVPTDADVVSAAVTAKKPQTIPSLVTRAQGATQMREYLESTGEFDRLYQIVTGAVDVPVAADQSDAEEAGEVEA